jgi:alkylhydroperoxidase/carboxymuconolactone decarboxylase family protein YurZ
MHVGGLAPSLRAINVSSSSGLRSALSSERGVRSHVRRGLDEGISEADLLHAITIAVPTAGFPATAAAHQWAREVMDRSTEPRE